MQLFFIHCKIIGMLESIGLGIIGSVIASFIFIWCQKYRKEQQDQSKFFSYEGTYTHHQLDGTLIVGSKSEFAYESPNIINIKTTALDDSNIFKARIFMNESSPDTGSGVYDYFNRELPEWGTIELQRSENKDFLFVRSTSKSNDTIKPVYKMAKIG